MRIAAWRLRVDVCFSYTAKWKSRDEVLYDKARVFVESRYPEWCDDYSVDRLNSRVATHLAERKAVLAVLDGRGGLRGGILSKGVPRYRWLRRRQVGTELCKRRHISRWW